MRVWPTYLLLAFLASCTAVENSPADWIARLRSDDPQVRDAAQERLVAAGVRALPELERAIETEKDSGVLASMKTIRMVIARRKFSETIPEAWKDEWFLIKKGDVRVGTIHTTTKTAEFGGVPVWVVTHEQRNLDDRGKEQEHFTIVATCRMDPGLSAVKCEVTQEAVGHVLHYVDTFRDDGWDAVADMGLSASEAPEPGSPEDRANARRKEAMAGVSSRLSGKFQRGASPLVFYLVPNMLERLSAARVENERFSCVVLVQAGRTIDLHCEFVEVTTFEFEGRDIAARRYRIQSAGMRDVQDFLLSDETGLLRWNVAPGTVIERTDEEKATEKH